MKHGIQLIQFWV